MNHLEQQLNNYRAQLPYRPRALSALVRKSVKLSLPTAIALLSATSAAPAFAEDGLRQLEEIVVTARKKEESLQDVPVVVNAVSGESIEKFALSTVQDMSTRVPGLNIHTGGSGQGAAIRMRGVGSQSGATSFEPSVALNFDSVVGTTARAIINSFFDIAQFEALKGPQSTYFGKGATAGVLSLTSNNPTDEFEASLSVGHEFELDTNTVTGIVSGPLTDNTRARLAARWSDTEELVENQAAGDFNGFLATGAPGFLASESERGSEALDLRLTLESDVTDQLTANLKFNYHEFEADGTNWRLGRLCASDNGDGTYTEVNNAPAGSFTPCDGDRDEFDIFLPDVNPALSVGSDWWAADGKPYQDNESWDVRLKLDYSLADNIDLVSVTAYTEIEDVNAENYDGQYFTLGGSAGLNEFEVFSQEFRIEGTLDAGVETTYMVGVFYEDHTQLFDAEQVIFALGQSPLGGTSTQPGFEGAIYDSKKIHETQSDTISYFGSLEFQLTDRISWGFGIRHTEVERDATIDVPFVHEGVNAFFDFDQLGGNPDPLTYFSGPTFSIVTDPVRAPGAGFAGGPIRVTNSAFEDTNLDVESTLNFQATDDLTVYLAYKEAYKPGGFDMSVVAVGPDMLAMLAGDDSAIRFRGETVSGYELGWKADLLDSTLRINGAFYSYDYEDLQAQQFNGRTVSFDTYNIAEQKSEGIDLDILWATPVEGLLASASLAWSNSELTEFLNEANGDTLDGREPEQSPEFSGVIGLDYEASLSENLIMGISYSLRFSDEYFTNSARNTCNELASHCQDAYETHALSLSLRPADDKWSLVLAGNNITDERYAVFSGDQPLGGNDISIRYGEPRTVRLTAKYNF